MIDETQPNNHLLPWKHYLTIALESLLGFYLATFSLALYTTHQGLEWIFCAILMGILYIFVIIALAMRIIQNLPVAAIMLIVPLVPLIALMMVVSLVPVLQKI